MRRDRALALLAGLRDEIRQRFCVEDLRLFGSTARDEASEDSDLDLLVRFDGPASFDLYFELLNFLEDRLGARVDLVTDRSLKDRLRRYVERDAIDVA